MFVSLITTCKRNDATYELLLTLKIGVFIILFMDALSDSYLSKFVIGSLNYVQIS
jgi:hypothetical protein